MPTLHHVADETRTVIKWGALLSIISLLLLVLFRIGIAVKEKYFPTPPPAPTVLFGKLPKQTFPDNNNNKNYSYAVDTLSGTLPAFPDRANVYAIDKPRQDLFTLKRARNHAAALEFFSDGTSLSDSLYKWADASRILTLDILLLNYTFTFNPDSKNTALTESDFQDQAGAITTAQEFIKKATNFPPDIDLSKTTTNLFLFTNGSIVTATSISATRVIRVDFYQKDIDSLKIYYPNYPYSSMYAIITGTKRNIQVIESSFFHQPLTTNTATYPIKTVSEAFSDLKNGNAYIVSDYKGSSDTIPIKNISLGYYASDKNQDYLMPIFAFEGNGGFFAFVSAIKDEWIQ